MNNSLAREFTFGSLLRFSFPSMIMMFFMSLYTMVDGVFVSRFAGTSALSAVNIVYPIISVVVAVGVMLATGGSAIIARKLGEGKAFQAKQDFSLIVFIGILIGIVISVLGLIFIHPLLRILGANDAIFGLCYDYAFPLMFFIPSGILLMLFQTLFVTAGSPHLGLAVTLMGGVSNIVLDYLFIVPMDMGIAGAAIATGIGYSVPAVFGLIYFSFHRKGSLYFIKPKFDKRVLLQSCANGSSEMVTNLSTAITTYLFNILMMKYAGENGVASITIVLYTQYLLTAIYMGYSMGTAPVFSYNYGTGNKEQLKKLFRISMSFLFVCSLMTFALAILFDEQIVTVFTDKSSIVFDMSVYGFQRFAVSFLFTGYSIFASSLFTAFSDGRVSASISLLRTFVFIVLGLLLLPIWAGIDGIWLAIPVAEVLGVIVSLTYLYKKRTKYSYA